MVEIRELLEQDIPIILPHLQEMYLEHDLKEDGLFTPNSFSTEQINNYLRSSMLKPSEKVYVALVDNEIAGAIRCEIKDTPSFYKERKVGYTDDLVVVEKYRKKGVATSLKKASEDWFKLNNINLLECKIYEWNEASSNLSKKLGYKKTFSYYYKHIRN